MRTLILTLAAALALTTPAVAQITRITPSGPFGPVDTYRQPRAVPPSSWVPAPPVRPSYLTPSLLAPEPVYVAPPSPLRRPPLGVSTPPTSVSPYEDARQLRCAQWPGLAVCR